MDHLWFKGQVKIIRRMIAKWSFIFFLIGLFVGTGLGMAWRMKHIEPEREAKIEDLRKKINYYQENWTPIKTKEIVKPKQDAGQSKKGK